MAFNFPLQALCFDVGGFLVVSGLSIALDAFKNRACTRLFTEDYKQPEPDEVKALIKLSGWSQTKVAKLAGVTYDMKKGSSTVRKWQAKKSDKKNHRDIPYSTWRLLLIYSGVVDINDDFLRINNESL